MEKRENTAIVEERFREKVYMDFIFQKCFRVFFATIIKSIDTEVL